ncbi:hypothetical protein G6F37_012151 [Rhizopus arrhizus]|nr:hypothetical protein G6F38_010364 [Rhizopus arrhizus]KAG1145390.1 hypothetical protein G6F37_012151 [Rhizopus arrhizus]
MRMPFVFNYSNLVSRDVESDSLLEDSKLANARYGTVFHSQVESPFNVLSELGAVLKYSIPLVITFLMGVGNRVWDVWFLGNIGSKALAVTSLGHLFTTVAGLSIGSGILSAIDTLVAQAYTGARYPHTIGIIFQRGLIVMFIFAMLVTIVCWAEFLKLGVPGMLSVSTDWAFEVCALLAGVLGQISLAAQSVVISINSLLLMIPSALSTGMSVRLGHLLGANEPRKAKFCVTLSTCLATAVTIVDSLLLYVYRKTIAYHFSTDPDVIEAIVQLLNIACLCHFVTGFGIVLSAALNALGKQLIVASLNLVSYYFVGLPFGLYLTRYHSWGLEGIWCGVLISGFIKSLVEFIIIFFMIDWHYECQLASKRIGRQEYTN